ncbi:hypothetical protein I317_05162 [Kwoniella heveanensis CBS 569]|nr:hypothetical protein I317_05162 [Kwoniella heveanensis CBS 569]
MSSQPSHPSTVAYQHEPQPPPPMTPLEPPDVSAILRSKRSLKSQILSLELPRPLQIGLTCFSISISALQANGVYCWGTYGPVVAKMLELDGTQAQTIVVGGILGVYLCAAPLGALTDKYGPRIGSFVSACLGLVGYQAFAFVLRSATPDTPYVHLWLTAGYFLVGAATVGSYFACLTCSSLSFPSHPTLSLSLPLSMIGLSALVLSSFSSLRAFQASGSTDLDPAKFILFLGILSPCVNIFGSLFMKVIPQPELFGEIKLPINDDEQADDYDDDDDDVDVGEMSESIGQLLRLDERTPMLIGGIEAAWEEVEAMEQGKDNWGVKELLQDYQGFWVFGILLALVIGPGEMVVASIGSIITSLLPPTSLRLPAFVNIASIDNPLALRNKHVFLFSIFSTLSRLVTGILADYLAPPLQAKPNPAHRHDPTAPSHLFVRKRQVRLSRSAFAALCAIVLGGLFAWCAGMLGGEGQGEKGLSILSGGVGAMYGAIFTLIPAIVSHHFGPTNFGLAWGMVSYFAALGSVVYSYLYAYLSVPTSSNHPGGHNDSSGRGSSETCYGPQCFRLTFVVCGVSCVIGAVGLVVLGKRWKV